jgi:SAM-dependent methyltransferase
MLRRAGGGPKPDTAGAPAGHRPGDRRGNPLDIGRAIRRRTPLDIGRAIGRGTPLGVRRAIGRGTPPWLALVVSWREASTTKRPPLSMPGAGLWRAATWSTGGVLFATSSPTTSGRSSISAPAPGYFSRAWAGWGAGLVVSCEPSAAMRRQAVREGLPGNVALVAGRAEQMPLATGSASILWLSTVVHHIGDLAAWAAETRRVLRPGGWLLIRNLFADLGTTSWLPELPGAERARRGFPSVSDIADLVASVGLDLVDAVEVAELGHGRTAEAAAEWIRTMRAADSLLLAFTDDELTEGLARLDGYPNGHELGPVSLGLAVFRGRQ